MPLPLYSFVMVTVMAPITNRMPAILEDEDWSKWLGEVPTSLAGAKAVLKTMEGVNWRMAKAQGIEVGEAGAMDVLM